MAECEANYHQLRKLLPELEVVDQYALGLPCYGEVAIQVLERTPYTELVEILQGESDGVNSWLHMPRLKVRLYHDAKLAEVIAFDGCWKVNPRNRYPNLHMYHPDEKAQWNQFLAEWLAMAMRHGYAAASPCEFGAL